MASLRNLDHEEVRRRTVLWLRGTGINAWHYYGFLQRFSLEQLVQFRRIICASGGAAVFWIYVLALRRHFDEAILDRYDEILRGVMNRNGFLHRAGRIISFRAPYVASQQLALLRELVSQEAFEWTLKEFPLDNFRFLAATGNSGYREFGERESDGALHVASMVAIGGTPSSGQDLAGCGIGYFDFELASSECRKAYQHELIARFPHDTKLILNTELQHLNASDYCSYLRYSHDRHPALMRALDLTLLFLNLPNDRYRRVFRWSRAVGYAKVAGGTE
jgi:hypothetical protein